MTQTVILTKLIKFLEYQYDDYLRDLDKQISLFPQHTIRIAQQKNEFINRNKKLSVSLIKGHCFGFALVHAAMDYSGKLDWWEEALVCIANWDEQPDSLNHELKLPGTVNQQDRSRLKDIIERVLNYIVTSHALETEYYFPDVTQMNILQPASKTNVAQPKLTKQGSYFEISDKQEYQDHFQVKTIKKREVIAGNFKPEQLMDALADYLSEKTIILVHTFSHAIRIARKGTQWMVYDPNYPQDKAPIYKMLSKADCINEIFKIHKTLSIAIEVACFDENAPIVFPKYDTALKTSAVTLLSDQGLSIIAQYVPDTLLKLMEQVDNSIKGKILLKVITKALTEKTPHQWTALHKMAFYSPEALFELMKQVNDSIEGKALIKAITQALTEKNLNGWSALYMMAEYSPKALFVLVKQIDDSIEGKNLIKAIIQALIEKTSQGWTALHKMARHSPDALFELMKQIDGSVTGQKLLKAITQMITEKTSGGWTTLHIIAQYSPGALFELIKRIDNLTEGKALLKAITTVLIVKISDGCTALHRIAENSPDALFELMKRIDDSIEGKALLKAITETLTEKTFDGSTVLRIMTRHSPKALLELMKRIDDSIEGRTLLKAITETLTEKTADGWSALHRMAQYSPEALLELIRRVDNSLEGRTLLKAITQVLTEKTSGGWIALHIIARNSPEALFELIKQIDDSIEGRTLLKAITKTLAEKTSDGSTALHIMARYSSKGLFELMKQVDDSIEGKELLKTITDMLTEKTVGGWTALHIMGQYSPKILFYILTGIDHSLSKKTVLAENPILLVLNMPNGLNNLLKILAAQANNNLTTWQYLCVKSLPTKKHMIECICNHLSKMNDADLMSFEKEIDDSLNNQNALYRGICRKSNLFYERYTKTELYLSMKKIIQKTKEKHIQELEKTPAQRLEPPVYSVIVRP